MIRCSIMLFGIVLLYSFTLPHNRIHALQFEEQSTLDTLPSRVDEALIRELSQSPKTKTWRDSGVWFQLESIGWQAIRLGTTGTGDVIALVSFSSADPSSLSFLGQAVFLFNPDDMPADITPSRGMTGEAMLSFPQDVLLCPSPSQEIGLGQNDPYFPLYLTGQLTGVNVAGGSFLPFETPITAQLRDLQIIL